MTFRVGVIDIGLGNHDAVVNALLKNGIFAEAFHEPTNVTNYGVLIFPGVGNWSFATKRLEETRFKDAILEHVGHGNGLIGICLGMQLLGLSSAEGFGPGLGLIDFEVENLSFGGIRTSIGWEYPLLVEEDWLGTVDSQRYYFVHSFGVRSIGASWERMVYQPGSSRIVAALQKNKVIGFQFHPERSLQPGIDLLTRAVHWLVQS